VRPEPKPPEQGRALDDVERAADVVSQENDLPWPHVADDHRRAPRLIDREGVALPGLPRERRDQVDPVEMLEEVRLVDAAQRGQPPPGSSGQRPVGVR
jgi:hypothetical protein